MDDLQLPGYYVVSRALPSDQVEAVRAALSITPVSLAIVSSVYDVELATQLCPKVVLTPTASHALAMAAEVGREGEPVLVVGDAPLLDAYYPDRKEAVNAYRTEQK